MPSALIEASTPASALWHGTSTWYLTGSGMSWCSVDDAFRVRLGQFLFDEQYDVVHLGTSGA